jgi:DNA invertase Pin-like site-specific DNA recombinase
MVSRLRRGDVVLCAKLDRAFRFNRDALNTLEHFRGAAWDLYLLDLGGSVIKSGVAELIFTMLAAAAQFERHRIKERFSDAKADQRERGAFLGGNRPLGWNVGEDGLLVEVPRSRRRGRGSSI